MRRSALVTVAVATCSATLATLATLGIAQNANNEIFACVSAQGTMRIVTAQEVCKDGETRLVWNKVGPQGPAGPVGKLAPETALAIEGQLKSIQEQADTLAAATPRMSTNPERRLRLLTRRLRAKGILKPTSTDEKVLAFSPMSLLANTKASPKAKLDSLSEMGEMESLRLQMAMDRMSKLMSTLSNIIKKQSETSAGIVQNIK